MMIWIKYISIQATYRENRPRTLPCCVINTADSYSPNHILRHTILVGRIPISLGGMSEA
jgi:hypothetical protein